MRAFDQLMGFGVAAHNIVFYGESLGTSQRHYSSGATADSRRTDLEGSIYIRSGCGRAFVLDSAGASHDDASLGDGSDLWSIQILLLILHGTLDRTAPFDMGRALARLTPEPKTFVEFTLGGHSDLYLDGNNVLGVLRSFFAGLSLSDHGQKN